MRAEPRCGTLGQSAKETPPMYLTHALHRAMQQNSDQPATIFEDRVRTFAQHADRVAQLAA